MIDRNPSPPVFILGAGRSGTTWLASIFDSHPDTFFIHEPDIIRPTQTLPFVPAADAIDTHVAAAGAYAEQLIRVRGLRAMQKRPFFPKTYRGRLAHHGRRGLILGLAGLEKATGRWLALGHAPVPALGRVERATPILKSVSSLNRLAAFAKAKPDWHFIHMLRHPGAIAVSLRRGAALGKMEPARFYEAQLAMPLSRAQGLTSARVAAMSDIEKTAWSWAVTNDFVMATTEGMGNVHLVRYEDLCADPIAVSQDLFARTGLAWKAQTAAFLRQSLETAADASAYHSVVRNPAIAAGKWKDQLSASEKQLIGAIIAPSRAGRLYPPDETFS